MKKHILALLFFISIAFSTFSQTAWVEPDNPDVTQTVRLYVNLDKVTNKSLDGNAGPFYIWTWKPTETTRADTLQNGTGDKPWKSSNDRLIMTKDDSKGARVYYYEMIPVEFYNCKATDVYTNGVSFLVKPKDGGGYGDPDLKTEDLNIVIAPPKLNRGLLYSVPKIMYEDQITSLVYDNPLETKTTMQNLQAGNVYMHMIATIKDTVTLTTSTIEPEKFFKVHLNPKLQMKKMPDGRFKLTMIPRKFFNVPDGSVLQNIVITVRKANYSTSADQTDEKSTLKYGCQ